MVYLGRAGLATLGNSAAGESPRTLPQDQDVGSSQKQTLLAAAATTAVIILRFGESPFGAVHFPGADRDNAYWLPAPTSFGGTFSRERR